MQTSQVRRTKSAAREAYDRLSFIYDLIAGSSEAPLVRQGLEMLQVSQGEQALEIGPGTGKALETLCTSAGGADKVHGIDLSCGMLKRARTRLESASLLGKACLLQGDGACLPYRSESFDVLFMSFTLELFEAAEIPLVLSDCHRVLKPGGRLGIVSMLQSDRPGMTVRLYEWLHAHFPTYADCRPIDTPALVQAAGFLLKRHMTRSMWRLPVVLMVAYKPS